MTLATIKQDILKQYKGLLNNRYITALNFLLSPCCSFSGTGVAVCTNINTFNVTITLDGPLPSFPVDQVIYVFAEDTNVVQAVYTAPNTITATLTFTGGGIINITQDVSVQILYPTAGDGSLGVYHSFLVSKVVFDGNPCD